MHVSCLLFPIICAKSRAKASWDAVLAVFLKGKKGKKGTKILEATFAHVIVVCYVTGCSSGNKTSRTWRCINRAIFKHKACVRWRRLFVILFTPATDGMNMLRSGVELFLCGSPEGAVGGWHACGIFLKAGIVQSYLQTPLVLFFFPLEVCCHIFAICDVQLGKSNRNSGLKLDVSKPFKMWEGVQAVPVNGSLWSAIESCCPAITDTLFIGSVQTGLVNCILELITYVRFHKVFRLLFDFL